MTLHHIQYPFFLLNHDTTVARQQSSSLSRVLADQMKSRLEHIKRSHLALTERLANPDVIADLNRLRDVMSESAQSEDVVHMYNEYTRLMREAGPERFWNLAEPVRIGGEHSTKGSYTST